MSDEQNPFTGPTREVTLQIGTVRADNGALVPAARMRGVLQDTDGYRDLSQEEVVATTLNALALRAAAVAQESQPERSPLMMAKPGVQF